MTHTQSPFPTPALGSPLGGARATASRAIRLPARRTVLGLAAVILCALGLAWRVHTIAREQRVPVDSRVTQLMYNRMLAQWIAAYARKYGRPAYFLDSVMAHLDSAERAVVSELRTDLWGERVGYFWTYCGFKLWSDGGRRPMRRPAPPASVPPDRRFARWASISEEYPWPPGVGRTDKCFGGS